MLYYTTLASFFIIGLSRILKYRIFFNYEVRNSTRELLLQILSFDYLFFLLILYKNIICKSFNELIKRRSLIKQPTRTKR